MSREVSEITSRAEMLPRSPRMVLVLIKAMVLNVTTTKLVVCFRRELNP